MALRDAEGNRLVVMEAGHSYVLQWECPDEDGCYEDGATIDAGTEGEDAIDRIALEVCEEFVARDEIASPVNFSPYRFPSRKIAALALRTIQARVDATTVVLPEWAQTALAAGWVPPRGWMGEQPREGRGG
jgi:hypothetical protein